MGTILVDTEDDMVESYYKIKLPDNWKMATICPGPNDKTPCVARAVRTWCLNKFSDQHFVGLLADDFVPMTPNWDSKLISALDDKKVFMVSGNDQWQNNRITGAVVFSGDLIRTIGYIYPPCFCHMYADNVWEEIAKRTGIWFLKLDVIIMHEHWTFGGAKTEFDKTYEHGNSFFAQDHDTFDAWMENDFEAVVKSVNGMIESKRAK